MCVNKRLACFVISTVLLLLNWVSCSAMPLDTAEGSGLAVAALVHVTKVDTFGGYSGVHNYLNDTILFWFEKYVTIQ